MPSKKIRAFIDENIITSKCQYCGVEYQAECKALNLKLRLHIKANHPTEKPMEKITHTNKKATLLASKRLTNSDSEMLKWVKVK